MKRFRDTLNRLDRTSVSVTILNRITERIIAGDLKPGDKLPTEQEFAIRLGVARNSVREAIKMLSSLEETEEIIIYGFKLLRIHLIHDIPHLRILGYGFYIKHGFEIVRMLRTLQPSLKLKQ